MKQKLLIVCLAIGLVGCKAPELYTGGPLPSGAIDRFDYVGELPPDVATDLVTAKQFATDLATEMNVKLSDNLAITDDIVEFNIATNKKVINIYVEAYKKAVIKNLKPGLFVTVNGDWNNPDAQAIAVKAEEIFAKKYPGYKLVRFIRYQGLGP